MKNKNDFIFQTISLKIYLPCSVGNVLAPIQTPFYPTHSIYHEFEATHECMGHTNYAGHTLIGGFPLIYWWAYNWSLCESLVSLGHFLSRQFQVIVLVVDTTSTNSLLHFSMHFRIYFVITYK